MNRFYCWLLLLVFPVMALAECRVLEDVSRGDTLPLFSVKSDSGKTFVSQGHTNRPAVIVFFNTHCWDCRQELPLLQQAYEEYGHAADFICISRSQAAEEIAAYWQREKLTLPYAAQEDRRVFSLFAEKTIPRIYIADAKGVVQKVFVEKVRKRVLFRALKQLFEQKK